MVQFCGQEVLIEKDIFTRGMSLTVNGDGKVIVRVGYRAIYTESEIQQFVDRHKRFLRNRLSEYSAIKLPNFSDGGEVMLLGKEYTVISVDENSSFEIEGDILKVPERFSYWESKKFFGDLLLPYVKALTELYAETYGLTCSYVKLHTWESAWGTHFDSDNSIKYNTALVFLPENCIEYVVAHELCHSLHSDHSAAFWAELERIYPHYKEDRELLLNYAIDWLLDRAKLSKRS
ncbi:MAG: M48 family metallopeptidase [Corallococcus sp.]|nr:M48 family metallopeptidase [Corallococcus sp.]